MTKDVLHQHVDTVHPCRFSVTVNNLCCKRFCSASNIDHDKNYPWRRYGTDPIAANVTPIYMVAEQEIHSGLQALLVNDSKRKDRFFCFRLLPCWRFNEPGHTDAKKVGKQVTKRMIAITNKLNEKLEEARWMFLDCMAAVSFMLINHEHDAIMSNGTFFDLDGNDDEITPQSDLLLPNQSIFIVTTTAALSWRTGTAVNPLLRAAHLARRAREINNNETQVDEQMNQDEMTANSTDLVRVPLQRQIATLVLPWLELEEDRLELYGPDMMFSSIQTQEDYIKGWL